MLYLLERLGVCFRLRSVAPASWLRALAASGSSAPRLSALRLSADPGLGCACLSASRSPASCLGPSALFFALSLRLLSSLISAPAWHLALLAWLSTPPGFPRPFSGPWSPAFGSPQRLSTIFGRSGLQWIPAAAGSSWPPACDSCIRPF